MSYVLKRVATLFKILIVLNATLLAKNALDTQILNALNVLIIIPELINLNNVYIVLLIKNI